MLTTLQKKGVNKDDLTAKQGVSVSQEFADNSQNTEFVADGSIDEILKKEDILKLPAQIFQPYRLMILMALRRFGALDFPALRDGIQIKSDGNLANHLRVLEDLKLIEYRKEFVGRKPKTFYELTPKGKEQLESLLHYLKDFTSDV
jgi:DNA-binding HxlR family transcriptional regulator